MPMIPYYMFFRAGTGSPDYLLRGPAGPAGTTSFRAAYQSVGVSAGPTAQRARRCRSTPGRGVHRRVTAVAGSRSSVRHMIRVAGPQPGRSPFFARFALPPAGSPI